MGRLQWAGHLERMRNNETTQNSHWFQTQRKKYGRETWLLGQDIKVISLIMPIHDVISVYLTDLVAIRVKANHSHNNLWSEEGSNYFMFSFVNVQHNALNNSLLAGGSYLWHPPVKDSETLLHFIRYTYKWKLHSHKPGVCKWKDHCSTQHPLWLSESTVSTAVLLWQTVTQCAQLPRFLRVQLQCSAVPRELPQSQFANVVPWCQVVPENWYHWY